MGGNVTAPDAAAEHEVVVGSGPLGTPGEHLSAAERVARGKGVRAEVPRSSHAMWEPSPLRRSPIELLEDQAKERLPELGPIRYGRMLVSPFTFFRGAAYLMAADLADGTRTGLHAQLCGDAHLSNFGVFRALDRRLVFSINDFDETLPGPFEWDVKRLAASLAVAARDRGFDEATRPSAVLATVRGYREAMAGSRRCATSMSGTRVWTSTRSCSGSGMRPRASSYTVSSARSQSRHEGQPAGAHEALSGGRRRAADRRRSAADHADRGRAAQARSGHTSKGSSRRMIGTYRETLPGDRRRLLERYRYVHAARKVVGVGSVGTRTWILLLHRPRRRRSAVPAVQRGAGVGAGAVPRHERVRAARPAGRRGPADDAGRLRCAPRLGTDRRHRRAGEGLLHPPALGCEGLGRGRNDGPADLATYGTICGWTLARAHARSGDPIAISAYLGSGDVFDQALAVSPRAMPTRTNATTRPSSKASAPAGSRQKEAFDPPAATERRPAPMSGMSSEEVTPDRAEVDEFSVVCRVSTAYGLKKSRLRQSLREAR